MNIKNLYAKYKDLIPYFIFGVLTTAVNVFVYWLFAHPLAVPTMPSTVIAWIVAVTFAYLTNRRWVFHSNANDTSSILKEILSFFSCRLLTGLLDFACMYIFVDVLHWNDVIIKFIANITVIILNYLASKFIIFRKK